MRFTPDELAAQALAAGDALEAEIAMEVHSASTERGYLTYEWGGRRYRVGLTLTEEN